MVDHFFIFQKNSLNLKTANFSNPSRWAIFTISKNSPGETGTSFCLKKEFEHRENGRKEIRTSDLYSWPVIRKNQTGRLSSPLFFSDKSENPHARVTGVHKFLTLTPPLVLVDNREASHQEMKPLWPGHSYPAYTVWPFCRQARHGDDNGSSIRDIPWPLTGVAVLM